MREVTADIDRWLAQGESIALATVLQTWGSSPRQVGAKLALTASGEVSGSVSGGCVEGAVIENGFSVIKTGKPQLLHFGVANDTAWEVGLACGGSIDVFVQRLDRVVYDAIRAALRDDGSSVIVTVIRGPIDLLGRSIVVNDVGGVIGTLGAEIDRGAIEAATEVLCGGQSQRKALSDSIELFFDVIAPAPEVIAVGGVHIAIALTQLAKVMGYRTTVVDPRGVFGTDARFPHIDRLIQAWPDEGLAQIKLSCLSAVAVLTHDPKLDDPALKIVLPSAAFYVGALGSPVTNAQRRVRLHAAGLSEADLDRLHSPIGLEIGSKSPEEIALAIMAEIVAARNGRFSHTH
jgi:xanthine dehydrogenase accessory factor